MQRSRLKNIINKSKILSNKQEVGNPFDEFKKSLPIEIDDNYRLEAAWKAYGSPKDYKTALWNGMIQPIDENNYKLPSIGYNEETDEYEYLNKGEDNETVAKDIRVWDNNVIPLVQELKLGGYVRTFNKEKDCWTYTKNLQKENTLDQNQFNIQKEQSGELIDSFQKGGKSENNEKEQIPSDIFELIDGDYYYWPDDDRALDFIKNNKWFRKEYKQWGEPKDGEKARLVTKKKLEDLWFEKNKEQIFKSLVDIPHPGGGLTPTGQYAPDGQELYDDGTGNLYTLQPQVFKQGGQMNVIPEGALHARKNNMEGAGEDFTAKGIPVVDNNGEQQAEIEKNEVIFNKDLTDFIENNLKKFNSEETSNSEKDEIAIKVGKRLVKELLTNTDDRTGLISEVEQKI